MKNSGIFIMADKLMYGSYKSDILSSHVVSDRLHVVCAQLMKDMEKFAAFSDLNETVQL